MQQWKDGRNSDYIEVRIVIAEKMQRIITMPILDSDTFQMLRSKGGFLA